MIKYFVAAYSLIFMARFDMTHTQCGLGWINYSHSCYQLSATVEKWDDARAHCETVGAELALPKTNEENNFLISMAFEKSPKCSKGGNLVHAGKVKACPILWINTKLSFDGNWVDANDNEITWNRWQDIDDHAPRENVAFLVVCFPDSKGDCDANSRYSMKWRPADSKDTLKNAFICVKPEQKHSKCIPNPCEHNGTCQEETNGFACRCPTGYVGQNCSVSSISLTALVAEDNNTKCTPNQCGQGTCVDGECDYCSPNQCETGECISTPNVDYQDRKLNFTCKCDKGYAGPKCTLIDNPCKTDPLAKCKNNGICRPKIQPGKNDWICLCPAGTHIGQAKDCSAERRRNYNISDVAMAAAVIIPFWAICCACVVFGIFECREIGELPDLDWASVSSLSSGTSIDRGDEEDEEDEQKSGKIRDNDPGVCIFQPDAGEFENEREEIELLTVHNAIDLHYGESSVDQTLSKVHNATDLHYGESNVDQTLSTVHNAADLHYGESNVDQTLSTVHNATDLHYGESSVDLTNDATMESPETRRSTYFDAIG